MWQWDRRLQGLVILFAAALIFAGGVKYAGWCAGQLQEASVVVDGGEKDGQAKQNAGSGKELAVHVAGAVSNPGVYYFLEGTRVIAAVEKAGPLPEADLNSLNLAQQLVDGSKIYVPRQGEASVSQGSSGSSSIRNPFSNSLSSSQNSGGKVNINTASVEELDKALPGIGPTLAQRIVDYREQHGPFRSPEDLKNVSGIGERRFEQIKDLVTI